MTQAGYKKMVLSMQWRVPLYFWQWAFSPAPAAFTLKFQVLSWNGALKDRVWGRKTCCSRLRDKACHSSDQQQGSLMISCWQNHIRWCMGKAPLSSSPALHSSRQPSAPLLAALTDCQSPGVTRTLSDDSKSDFLYYTHPYRFVLTTDPSSEITHDRVVCKVSTNKWHFL